MMRAVVYARCSTEEERQQDALKKQVAEAKECVERNGWLLTDIYVESRSGTSTKGREQYHRLYEDLEKDLFEVVVIKSQDRLMRNTKDWYLFIDRLGNMQKRLYLYLEQKFYCPDDALLTGIKAILAEEYSRELSKKMNNAHHNRQKNGGAVILTSNTYGYRKTADKRVEVIETEAAVKRRMYELCAAGYGCRRISAILEQDGIVNRKGHPFSDSDILRMIRNPINKGTVVMNRIHYDFESKRRIKMAEEKQYIYEKKIPAIVTEELWDQANDAISNRRDKGRKEQYEKEKNLYVGGTHSGKTFLSGKLQCGLCEEPYCRAVRTKYHTDEKLYEWKCRRYLKRGRTQRGDEQQKQEAAAKRKGCENIHLKEETLLRLLDKVCGEEYRNHQTETVKKMIEMSEEVFRQGSARHEIEREIKAKAQIQEKMNRLVDKLLEGVISDQIYHTKQRDLEQNMEEIIKKIQELEKKKGETKSVKKRLADLEKFLNEENRIREVVAAGILEDIEKIVIYPSYMKIWFSPQRMTEIDPTQMEKGDGHIKIEYGNLFCIREQRREEREDIVDLIKENPNVTARQIADRLHRGISKVRYQMSVLKREGRISFVGRGGKGKWEAF